MPRMRPHFGLMLTQSLCTSNGGLLAAGLIEDGSDSNDNADHTYLKRKDYDK